MTSMTPGIYQLKFDSGLLGEFNWSIEVNSECMQELFKIKGNNFMLEIKLTNKVS